MRFDWDSINALSSSGLSRAPSAGCKIHSDAKELPPFLPARALDHRNKSGDDRSGSRNPLKTKTGSNLVLVDDPRFFQGFGLPGLEGGRFLNSRHIGLFHLTQLDRVGGEA